MTKEQIKQVKDIHGKGTKVSTNKRSEDIFELIVVNTEFLTQVTTYCFIDNELFSVSGNQVRVYVIEKMEKLFKEEK